MASTTKEKKMWYLMLAITSSSLWARDLKSGYLHPTCLWVSYYPGKQSEPPLSPAGAVLITAGCLIAFALLCFYFTD
jgi:hypothetical protein